MLFVEDTDISTSVHYQIITISKFEVSYAHFS